jgi:hypothetical protein
VTTSNWAKDANVAEKYNSNCQRLKCWSQLKSKINS